MSYAAAMHGLTIWAYCLMPNHVHIIASPETENGLARGIGTLHTKYTRMINFRKKWRGYLWQGRFTSFPMDDEYLLRCARYIYLNPVRAKLVRKPWRWKWSSLNAHLTGTNEHVESQRLGEYVDDWEAFLDEGISDEELERLRLHGSTGKPLGGKRFLAKISRIFGEKADPKKTGRPRK